MPRPYEMICPGCRRFFDWDAYRSKEHPLNDEVSLECCACGAEGVGVGESIDEATIEAYVDACESIKAPADLPSGLLVKP